ncbi:MAG: hypothetical protein ACXW3C_01945 [Pyrinomonadaceae bacterium]
MVNLTNDPNDDASPLASPDRSKIAFISRRDGNPRIYVMDANGSNTRAVTQNTNDLAYVSPFSWSPDGSKLAFVRFVNFVQQISVIDVNGSNLVTLTSNDGDKDAPAWSPDGTRIAFTRKSDFNNTIQRYNMDLYVMNADGSNQTQLTNGLPNSEPAWSPDGTTIAFVALGNYSSTFERPTSEIRLINADGSNLRQLTTFTRSTNPTWSPDGTKIAFSSYRSNNFNFDIFVMNADGANQVNLTNDLLGTFQSGFPPDDAQPAWSPEGTQIAFTRLGTEVHVINADGTGNLILIQGQSLVRFPTWIRPAPSTPPSNPIPSVLSTDGRVIAAGSSTALTATLKDNSGGAISGRSVTLTLGAGAGAQSCSALTNSNGVATCTISNVTQPLGPGTLSADFAGDANYLPSSGVAETIIFSYLSATGGGSFVVGDVNALAGNSITFWDSQWSNTNELSDGQVPSSFKGFAGSTSTNPMQCGGSWSTSGGNSSGPPSQVPSYMAVIVSSSITKSGSIISGNISRIVIVRTNQGYSGSPGHSGTGTVVGVFCPP